MKVRLHARTVGVGDVRAGQSGQAVAARGEVRRPPLGLVVGELVVRLLVVGVVVALLVRGGGGFGGLPGVAVLQDRVVVGHRGDRCGAVPGFVDGRGVVDRERFRGQGRHRLEAVHGPCGRVLGVGVSVVCVAVVGVLVLVRLVAALVAARGVRMRVGAGERGVYGGVVQLGLLAQVRGRGDGSAGASAVPTCGGCRYADRSNRAAAASADCSGRCATVCASPASTASSAVYQVSASIASRQPSGRPECSA